jgi:TonB family protein
VGRRDYLGDGSGYFPKPDLEYIWPQEVESAYVYTFSFDRSATPQEIVNLDSIRKVLEITDDSMQEKTVQAEMMPTFLSADKPLANGDSPSKPTRIGDNSVSSKQESSRGIDKTDRDKKEIESELIKETSDQEKSNSDLINESNPQPEMKAPFFAGGREALNHFIYQHLRYPRQAKENNIEGKVMLKLWIEVDGKVAQIGIMESLGYGCDEEAVRIVQNMPTWIPGEKGGQKRGMWAYVPCLGLLFFFK